MKIIFSFHNTDCAESFTTGTYVISNFYLKQDQIFAQENWIFFLYFFSFYLADGRIVLVLIVSCLYSFRALPVLHGQVSSRDAELSLPLPFLNPEHCPRKNNYPESQLNLSPYPQRDAAHTALLVPKTRLLLTCHKTCNVSETNGSCNTPSSSHSSE